MELYFNTTKIADFANKEEMYDLIKNYLKVDDYEIPYFRIVEIDNNRTMIDYGSHINFFYAMTSFDKLCQQTVKQ